MFTERCLRDKSGVRLEPIERDRLEAVIGELRTLAPRRTVVRAGETIDQSTLLVEGIMSRYIDDRHGVRQLVPVHVPGDFVDLHAYRSVRRTNLTSGCPSWRRRRSSDLAEER